MIFDKGVKAKQRSKDSLLNKLQLNRHKQKNKKKNRHWLDPHHEVTKSNKMDHRPKRKMQTDKALEDNIGEKLGDFRYCDDFLDTTQKAWFMEEITGNLELIKIKTFCSSEHCQESEKTRHRLEEIFMKAIW